MVHVPVRMVVGANDLDTAMLDAVRSSNAAEQAAERARVERMKWVHKALEVNGVTGAGPWHCTLHIVGLNVCVVEAWIGPFIDTI